MSAHGGMDLQMDVNVETNVDGVRALGEITGAVSGRALYGEGIVIRIGQVAAPEGDDYRAEIVVGVCT